MRENNIKTVLVQAFTSVHIQGLVVDIVHLLRMVGTKMCSTKDFFILISFCSIFLYGSTMVGSMSLTKSQGNRWPENKPSLIHLKDENGSEKPAPGSEVNLAENILNYNPPLAKNRLHLTRDHIIVKRNASDIPLPTFKIPANFTLPPPPTFKIPASFTLPPPPTFKIPDSFTLPPHIIIPVPEVYPVCETEKSCLGRCTHNRTEWKTDANLACSCDPDCYEVFNDCCADYVKDCGAQKPQNVSTKQYKWSCEPLGILDNEYCTVADGIWMVTQCSHDWPNDTMRTNCENPLQKLTSSSPDHTRYLPVVSQQNITFRNLYCALCNGVNDFCEPWPLNIETTVIPPENYNLTQKIQFLLDNGATILDKGPKASQPRRYCLNEQYDDSCPSNKPSPLCKNGPIAIVWAGRNLKNLNCAFCNDLYDALCFPIFRGKQCEFFTPKSFSLVLDYQRNNDNAKSELSIARQTCFNQDMVYDDILQVCRVDWLDPPDQNGQARFYVVAWLVPQLPATINGDFSADDIRRSLVGYLNVLDNQIFDVNISSILKPIQRFQIVAEVKFFLVSSTIVLTPQQSLELLSTQKNSEAASTRSTLLNFIYFKDPFVLNIKNSNYTTVKTTSRPITCSGRKLFIAEEYTLLDGGRVYINSTNTTYEKSQYFRENIQQLNASSLGDNITVCEEYVPARCKAVLVILAPKQFTTLRNLSIFHNETSSQYDYGQYDIFDNGSVAVCVPYKQIPGIFTTIRDDKVLGWITVIGFFLSILSLIFLLVTYILFPKLQTLPGKNLMNLAVALLLFELSWVLSSFDDLRKNTSFCKASAILSHYSLLAYFVSMVVIAFHTCKVFARQMVAPKPSKSHERKLFILYSMFVWFVPAIFVIISIILDEKQIVNVGYGDDELCYLGGEIGYLYFMTIPIAPLLLFNVVTFIVTVIYLRKHGQNTAARQASGARQSNLSIYTKLSTLMGFSWLFAFLSYVYDAEPVFWYFFVILTSLQGVFVTFAFVVNKKTLKLYQKSKDDSKRSATSSRPQTTATTCRIHTVMPHNYQDTKL